MPSISHMTESLLRLRLNVKSVFTESVLVVEGELLFWKEFWCSSPVLFAEYVHHRSGAGEPAGGILHQNERYFALLAECERLSLQGLLTCQSTVFSFSLQRPGAAHSQPSTLTLLMPVILTLCDPLNKLIVRGSQAQTDAERNYTELPEETHHLDSLICKIFAMFISLVFFVFPLMDETQPR